MPEQQPSSLTDQNALIRNLHQKSALPLGECRRLLQGNGWDVQQAFQSIPSIPTGSSSGSGRGQVPSSNNSSSGQQRGISTLSSISSSSSSSGEGKKKDAQTFYTGGAMSGMAVQAPPSSSNNPLNPSAGQAGSSGESSRGLVDAILKKAASSSSHGHGHGQEEGEEWSDDDEDLQPKMKVFQGAGNRLDSTISPSSTSPSTGSPSADGKNGGKLEKVRRTLTFWKDGFTISSSSEDDDHGELYKYDDPPSKALLESIMAGRAPLSLFGLKMGQRADVSVVQRPDEVFASRKRTVAVAAFSGSGQRLGSHLPSSSASSSSAPSTPAVTSSSSGNAGIEIDNSKIVTSLQIRLADGTRLVARFNTSHTIGDIRRFILASRPPSSSSSRNGGFVLEVQFPKRVLESDGETIEHAGLKNGTVFQKLV